MYYKCPICRAYMCIIETTGIENPKNHDLILICPNCLYIELKIFSKEKLKY